jgi:hypothetical protein
MFTNLYKIRCEGKYGNGANRSLFGGGERLRVAGGQTGCGCHFRPPFLWFISFGGAKEMNKNNIMY